MKLDNFRELLIKKCDNENLKTMLAFIREDVLSEFVLESLEKMADAKHKGDFANIALRNFATEMDPEIHPEMIRDALGHHASRYRAALKAGRQDIANSHASHFFNLVDLAKKAQKHSAGKLDVSAVSPHAWERNSKLNRYAADHPMVVAGKRKPGDFVTDTKGWSYRGKDFSFLNQAPHESAAAEIRRHGHNGAYPMEMTRINGKHIHVDDIDPSQLKGFEKHEFDHHPINEHGHQSAGKRTPEDDAKYDQHALDFDSSPHMESFLNRHQSNLEQGIRHGKEPSVPVHEPVSNPLDTSKSPAPAAPASAPAPASAAAPSQPKMSQEDFLTHIHQSDLPDHVKVAIAARLKGGN